ncbi:hypothetical protein ADUPG1_001777 [Aduncisulcus paluster]|uniref:Uncharacterized protein n=1 Tax=Aduncisulcus paluster TaxID=2918883 RepID=A0ABQ5KHK1_9EUKA|nr:hypothetical protein ADUPG1_001777 [Aduncisulcus paluster]
MEERHQIVALGAGAASKMVYLEENRFERVSNSKGVEDYIERIDEMIEKKRPYLLGAKSVVNRKDSSVKYAVCVFKVGPCDQLGWHRGKNLSRP